MNFKGVEIIKDTNLLSPEYIPQKIIGRTKEISDLEFNLSYFFRDFPTLPSFMISGSSGTGKTLVLKKVLKDFKEECKIENQKIKIVFIKGSECRSKYEVLKSMLKQLSGDKKLPRTSADCYDRILEFFQNSEYSVLLIIDEIHEIKNSEELNSLLFTVSRFGEDKGYSEDPEQKVLKKSKTHYGYILVTNDALITRDLKPNTRSSLTKESLQFLRYSPDEISAILIDRINSGAFYEGKIDEMSLNLISALSIAEGEDARYGLLLLTNTAKYCERQRLEINQEIIQRVNQNLRRRLLLEIILDLPGLYKKILQIIYELYNNKEQINSKKIFEVYDTDPHNKKLIYSRISQIITFLEKEKIIYVKGSKGNNLRSLSIGENLEEIKQALMQEGLL